MYKKNEITKTTLLVNDSYEGETIENKIRRIVNNKEPIKDGAPLIYTERAEGVKPEYDIRTDRFEVAIDAMDHVSKSYVAKRKSVGEKAKEGMKQEEQNEVVKSPRTDGGAEPIQGTK